MTPEADVCLIVEGGYPYILGGVASWMDGLIHASPTVKFHVISITISSQPKIRKYELPDNVTGITDVVIDHCPLGPAPKSGEAQLVAHGVELIRATLGNQ